MQTKTKRQTYLLNQSLQSYLFERILFRLRKINIRFGLNHELHQDYFQDMMLETLVALERFDPDRSSIKTFINGILDKYTKYIVRKEQTKRMRCSHTTLSDMHVQSISINQANRFKEIDLRIDINSIILKMPYPLQITSLLLMNYSVNETAKRLKLSRSTIYRRIAKIREYFEAIGYGCIYRKKFSVQQK